MDSPCKIEAVGETADAGEGENVDVTKSGSFCLPLEVLHGAKHLDVDVRHTFTLSCGVLLTWTLTLFRMFTLYDTMSALFATRCKSGAKPYATIRGSACESTNQDQGA